MHLAEAKLQPDELGTISQSVLVGDRDDRHDRLRRRGAGDRAWQADCYLTIFAGLALMALPVGIIATAFAEQIRRRDFIVTWGMIARVPLFAELDAAEISDVMELLRAQVAEPGEIIVREGDAAHSMYFIAAGEVEIALGKSKKEPLRLGVGQFFGEVAVLRRSRRSATVTALTRTNLLVLDAHDLHALMQRDRRIAERIKDAGREARGPRGDLSQGRYCFGRR